MLRQGEATMSGGQVEVGFRPVGIQLAHQFGSLNRLAEILLGVSGLFRCQFVAEVFAGARQFFERFKVVRIKLMCLFVLNDGIHFVKATAQLVAAGQG